MRMIKLNPKLLMEALRGKVASSLNLPDDVELLDIKCDLFSGQVVAIVRSDRFEDTAESYPIPELTVASEASPKPEAPAVVASVLPNVKPVQKIPVRAKQGTGASGIEKEFSPEQRELLSFTVDGDYVIVKPTQFLKEEWNEINDVVKSLGGRWVKGDITSYWEIPLP
ncbi:hypothetical protein G4O51_01370 [Candidatus Bathyarchaeota archaeon A05DMB-2]|nr:hypothetical protein [Candidatus Bathyarchaeota archaeon A05DMB-2]